MSRTFLQADVKGSFGFVPLKMIVRVAYEWIFNIVMNFNVCLRKYNHIKTDLMIYWNFWL